MAIFKKSSRKRLSHEISGLKKYLLALLIVGLAAGVLVGFWFLSQLGPRNVDFRDFKTNTVVPESVKALQQESVKLEAQFEEILVLREA